MKCLCIAWLSFSLVNGIPRNTLHEIELYPSKEVPLHQKIFPWCAGPCYTTRCSHTSEHHLRLKLQYEVCATTSKRASAATFGFNCSICSAVTCTFTSHDGPVIILDRESWTCMKEDLTDCVLPAYLGHPSSQRAWWLDGARHTIRIRRKKSLNILFYSLIKQRWHKGWVGGHHQETRLC